MDAGAAMLWPVEDIPVVNGDRLIAGWFSVPHSESADRLIMDRRPQNHGERRLSWLRLPLGCMLGRMVIAPHKSCRGSGYDLTNSSANYGNTRVDLIVSVSAVSLMDVISQVRAASLAADMS